MAVPRLPSSVNEGEDPGEFSTFPSLASEILKNAAAPTQFGLRLGMFRWSDVLRDAAVVQMEDGPSELLAPTLRLDFWGTNSIKASELQAPPPRTLFVGKLGDCVPLRSASYVTPEAAIQRGATPETLDRHGQSINGSEWILFQEWTVESIQRCGDREIPRTATLRHPACPDLVDSAMEITSATVLSRVEAAEIFRLEGFAPPATAPNEAGATLAGDPPLRENYQAIVDAGVPVRVAESVMKNADLLRRASCGPSALFAVAQLGGGSVSMERLRAAFDPGVYSAESVSLRDLAAAARRIGAQYVEHRQSPEDRFKDIRIVHLADPLKGMLHFSVAFPSGDLESVVLFDPPVGVRRLTWPQFATHWTGYSLAPIDSVDRPIPKLAWAAIGLGVAAAVIAARRYRGARLRSCAALGLCALLISCGESTSGPTPDAPQAELRPTDALPLEVVGGASSLRCGMVERGMMGAARFGILNTADEHVQIHEIKKSCGCTTFELGSDRLAPGELTEATAWVDTTHVSGEFSVEVTLLAADSTPLGVFVVSGRSVEGNRIRIEPSLIDVPYGATVGSRMAELIVSGDSETGVQELSGMLVSVGGECAAALGDFGASTVVGARVERRAPILLGESPNQWGGSALITVTASMGTRVVSGRAVMRFQEPEVRLESSAVYLGVVAAGQLSERFFRIASKQAIEPSRLSVSSTVNWIEARIITTSAGVGVLLSYRPTEGSAGVVRGELEIHCSGDEPRMSVPIVAVVDSL